jgi:hypothetical protein
MNDFGVLVFVNTNAEKILNCTLVFEIEGFG